MRWKFGLTPRMDESLAARFSGEMVISLKRLLLIAACIAAALGVCALLTRKPARAPAQARPSNEQITPPATPPLDETMWAEGQFPDGPKYRVNPSTAMFLFDIEPWSEQDAKIGTRIWPSYQAAFDAIDSSAEPCLTSLDAIVGLAKFQEDEMLATLEKFFLERTQTFLDGLVRALQSRVSTASENLAYPSALGWAMAAKKLSQPSFKTDDKLARRFVVNFQTSKTYSEPLSFTRRVASWPTPGRCSDFSEPPWRKSLAKTRAPASNTGLLGLRFTKPFPKTGAFEIRSRCCRGGP